MSNHGLKYKDTIFDRDNPFHLKPRLRLITDKEFQMLPDGFILWTINRYPLRKGYDPIDRDTRGGLLAMGYYSIEEDESLAFWSPESPPDEAIVYERFPIEGDEDEWDQDGSGTT